MFQNLNARNKPCHLSTPLPLNSGLWLNGVDSSPHVPNVQCPLSPKPYLPTGIATFPFPIIMNDSALPPRSLCLSTSLCCLYCRDVINHVDTLLVLILGLSALYPAFSLNLTPCLSISVALSRPH